jgi:hypothetical protein
LPPHRAVRLCLTGVLLFEFEAMPLFGIERRSLLRKGEGIGKA